MTFADMGVPIDTRAARRFGIVRMEDLNVAPAERLSSLAERALEPGLAGDIETRGEEVAGIEAEADREVGEVVGKLAEGLQLFEAGAEAVASSGGVLEEDGHRTRAEIVSGIAQAESERRDSLLPGATLGAAGMYHQVLGSDGRRALQLTVKGGDGSRADQGVVGREIDQIAGVNYQGIQIVAFPGGPQPVDIRHSGDGTPPHTGAGGEDLKSVCAQLRGFEGRFFERTGNRCVNPETQGRFQVTTCGELCLLFRHLL